MKKAFFLMFLLFVTSLFAVHNFTINGSDDVTISVGDTLELSFDFEEEGNSATMEIVIYVSSFDFPVISPENAVFTDGQSLDETPVDGHFLYHFENFALLPQTSYITLKLTDDDITDQVTIHFSQISSDFSIAGTILKEGTHINTAVRGAFVYSFYNASKEQLNSLFENPTVEDFMDYMQQDRYFLSVLSNNTGDYQIYIPDDIENVPCTIDVFSSLDTNQEKVSPATQNLTVNGNLTDIDLIYYNPDGYFNGYIYNTEGDSLANSTIIVKNADSTSTVFTFSDSLGSFNIPLLNDDYSYKILKKNYQEYSGNFTIDNQDVYADIVLAEEITSLDIPQNVNFYVSQDSLFISWQSVENAEYYDIYSTDNPAKPKPLWDYETRVSNGTDWSKNLDSLGEKRFFYIKAGRE